MMKKMRKFFVVALAALFATACSNDDVLSDGGVDRGGNGIEGDAYIALKIRSVTGTRSITGDDPYAQEYGTVDESTISDALILFFDATGILVDEVPLTADISTPGQPTGISGAAFKVSSIAEKLLVVANPSTKFAARSRTIGTTTYNQINEEIYYDYTSNTADFVGSIEEVIGSSKNRFMMTNAAGKLMPVEDGGGDNAQLVLYTTSAEAEAKPQVIHIDRVAAKVRVSLSRGVSRSYYEGASFYTGTVEWTLNVTNRRFFPASGRHQTQAEITFNRWVWSDLFNQGSYRTDPNYDNTSSAWNTAITNPADQASYNPHYNYYHTGNASTIQWKPTTYDYTTTGYEYCLENTQQKVDNMHAYTTHALIRAEFAPYAFLKRVYDDAANTWAENPNPISNTEGATANWLKIGTGFYNKETLLTWIRNEVWAMYEVAEGITPVVTNAFNAYLAAIGATELGIITKENFYLSGANFNERWDVSYKTLYDNAWSYMVNTAGSSSFGSVAFYKGGINYYKIMIKHDDYEATDFNNQLGEFGVVRNSVYDIIIRNINNPGYPVIPNPDPEAPDEDETMQYMSIQINVNPWTWYTQYTDL